MISAFELGMLPWHLGPCKLLCSWETAETAKKQMDVGRGWVRFLTPRISCGTYVTKLKGTGTGVWVKAG